MRYTKTLRGTKKNKKQKTNTRCTKHRQAQKKTNPATIQKWTHSSWIFLVFFGACAGLVHLVVVFFCLFFWCLCRFGDSDFTKQCERHQKNKKQQTTRCTKHRQAPKKTQIPATTRKWTHSSWIFFWCLWRFGDSDFTKHWHAKKTNH